MVLALYAIVMIALIILEVVLSYRDLKHDH